MTKPHINDFLKRLDEELNRSADLVQIWKDQVLPAALAPLGDHPELSLRPSGLTSMHFGLPFPARRSVMVHMMRCVEVIEVSVTAYESLGAKHREWPRHERAEGWTDRMRRDVEAALQYLLEEQAEASDAG